MVKGVFCVVDVEHIDDIQHFRTLIIDNGGTIDKVVWKGDDEEAYIIFSAPTKQQVQTIKTILKNG